jgi:hypothetical protein
MFTVKVFDDIQAFGEDNKFVRFKGQVKKNFIPKDSKNPCDFFDFVCFREQKAKFIKDHFKKGDYILITDSEVVNNNYKKNDGTMVYGTQININDADFFGAKSEDGATPAKSDDLPFETEDKPAKKASAPATDEFDNF